MTVIKAVSVSSLPETVMVATVNISWKLTGPKGPTRRLTNSRFASANIIQVKHAGSVSCAE